MLQIINKNKRNRRCKKMESSSSMRWASRLQNCSSCSPVAAFCIALMCPIIIIIKDSLLFLSPLQKLLGLGFAIASVHHFAATVVACRTSAIVVNLLNEFLGIFIRNVLYLYSCTANINNYYSTNLHKM